MHKNKKCIYVITADIGDDPIRHGDTDYCGNIRKQKQQS